MSDAKTEQPSNQTSTRSHCSFLLRCWHGGGETSHGSALWRFGVREIAENPQEYSFNSPGELLDFLLTRLGEEKEETKHSQIDDAV